MKLAVCLAVAIISCVSVNAAQEPRQLSDARDQYSRKIVAAHIEYKQQLERLLAAARNSRDQNSIPYYTSEIELVQQQIDAKTVKVIEGFGSGAFRLGATRDDLIKALGTPDNDPRSSWLKWDSKGIHCIMDDRIGATELRFERGFRGRISENMKIGSSEKEVQEALGEPSKVTDDGKTKRMEYANRGMIVFLDDGKVMQAVISKK